MNNILKSVLQTACAVAIIALSPVSTESFSTFAAAAQNKKPVFKSKRKKGVMTPAFYKRYEKANEFITPSTLEGEPERSAEQKVEDLAEAEEMLMELIERKRSNDYERATAWQMISVIYHERDNTPKAIEAMEEMLKLRESIREQREHGILYNLAQLNYMEENFEKSLDYIAEWEKLGDLLYTPPSTMQRIFIAQLYYTVEDFRNALTYLYSAIDEANDNPEIEVKENWYLMVAAAHYELGEIPKYRDVLEILVVNYGKPGYYLQLAGVYSELGEDETFYSLQEAAYRMGFVDDKPAQIVNTAQIMFAREAPIKAAWILEKAFKENRIEDNMKNRKLLGQAYMMASEFKKSVKPLKNAATKAKDGQLWFQVGQVEMQNADYKNAVQSLEKAIQFLSGNKNKKDKNSRMASLLLKGNGLVELKRYKEARKAFLAVQKIGNKSQRRQASGWLKYVKSEEAREAMLKG